MRLFVFKVRNIHFTSLIRIGFVDLMAKNKSIRVLI